MREEGRAALIRKRRRLVWLRLLLLLLRVCGRFRCVCLGSGVRVYGRKCGPLLNGLTVLANLDEQRFRGVARGTAASRGGN